MVRQIKVAIAAGVVALCFGATANAASLDGTTENVPSAYDTVINWHLDTIGAFIGVVGGPFEKDAHVDITSGPTFGWTVTGALNSGAITSSDDPLGEFGPTAGTPTGVGSYLGYAPNGNDLNGYDTAVGGSIVPNYTAADDSSKVANYFLDVHGLVIDPNIYGQGLNVNIDGTPAGPGGYWVDDTSGTPGENPYLLFLSILSIASDDSLALVDTLQAGSTHTTATLLDPGRYLLLFYGEAVDHAAQYGAGIHAVIPIPPAILLFASGLVGLVGVGRRRMKVRAAA